MTLTIEGPAPLGAPPNSRRSPAYGERGARTIEIGLVNNMPDAAVAATRRQFVRLIEDASDELDVRLSLFALDATRRAMAEEYAPASALEGARLDALVVTGAEPHAADLRDEPYWEELGFVLDWAAENTISSLFS